METTIKKWGNSLGVRLPRSIIKHHALEEGARVILDEHKHGIIIRKLPEDDDVDLDFLVRRITKKNRHEEIDWGPPVGREIW
jgi:antitoxin MazE